MRARRYQLELAALPYHLLQLLRALVVEYVLLGDVSLAT